MKKKKLVRILVAAVCLLVMTAGLFAFDTFVDRSGWREKDGKAYYRDFHGRKVTGWLETEYGRYYLGDDHYMVTGWQTIDGMRYWFAEDGTMATGWQKIDDEQYYFAIDGSLQQGWLNLDSSRYYLSPAMVTGWLELDGSRYYFAENGAMVTGWLDLESAAYYLDSDGIPVTGKVKIDDQTYYFMEDGTKFHGWIDLEDGRYYFDESGVMVTGWVELNNKQFHFGDDGVLTVGWLEDGEYSYYLTADDGVLTGKQTLDGSTYYFTPDGIHVLLVNSNNPLSEGYSADLVRLNDNFKIASVCLEPLQTMLADCLNAGGEYVINNTYRSYTEQQEVLDTRVERLQEEDPDLSDEDALEEALSEVQLPGTSEHQTGLCADINGNGVESVPWLLEHCWEYGFILRYPDGKQDVTGIKYESWHFRYVGTKVSIPMHNAGVCLEEYLGAA